MTKEEILAISREENKNKDERERATFTKAGQKACATGGMVCMFILIIEAIFNGEFNLAVSAVYLSMTGTMLLVKYLELKKKHELVFAVIQLILAAVFFVMYVLKAAG